jgi:hypothetical protein
MGVIYTISDSLIDQKDFPEYTLVEIGDVDHENLDRWMHHLIQDLNVQAINIFLPLVFGSTGSDLLGLRLALHIRTTQSSFQNANIFIYGTESLYKIRQYEFACIFKTKGIALIDYNFHKLKENSTTGQSLLNLGEIASEMGKIHLEVPRNYFDNHSIANIWGMYRMLEMAQIDYTSINSMNSEKNQLHNIYFKWLLAKNLNLPIVKDEILTVTKQSTKSLSELKTMTR